ncbi:MAG: FHA domain-containing protein, partial [Deltaproteobacteria bacterium]|nr:FHA domain-containing protein [Deltaproteobacteria bacterium]
MPHLNILTADGQESTYVLEKDLLSIGRSKDSDIALPDHTVSRKHAHIKKTPEGYVIIDQGSHNGTAVNGAKISDHLLGHNDQIKIGGTQLTYIDELKDVEPAAPRDKPKTVFAESLDQMEEEILRSGPIHEKETDQGLLVSLKGEKNKDAPLQNRVDEKATSRISLMDMEKSNKILYVLYQISRKLNTVPDFDELLSAIMDSIFQVIDADYGFVATLGDGTDDLIPKVVKYRTAPDAPSQELRVSRTIINKVVNDKVSVLTSNAMEDDRFGGAKSLF